MEDTELKEVNEHSINKKEWSVKQRSTYSTAMVILGFGMILRYSYIAGIIAWFVSGYFPSAYAVILVVGLIYALYKTKTKGSEIAKQVMSKESGQVINETYRVYLRLLLILTICLLAGIALLAGGMSYISEALT